MTTENIINFHGFDNNICRVAVSFCFSLFVFGQISPVHGILIRIVRKGIALIYLVEPMWTTARVNIDCECFEMKSVIWFFEGCRENRRENTTLQTHKLFVLLSVHTHTHTYIYFDAIDFNSDIRFMCMELTQPNRIEIAVVCTECWAISVSVYALYTAVCILNL